MPSEKDTISITPFTEVERKANGTAGDKINNNDAVTKMIPHDPLYVQRARVTRAAPPKPACNPMQFVQSKPCNLYQSAHEQLKRAEEVKKVKEIKKEEPEDWQSNLDNWKSSRRKRVEHIIDRVVEVKKLELEEHDRNRRKSKTFSEMMEERTVKGRKMSLPVFLGDDTNDLSDLGIGTSSASGKSSLSEDYDNHSVISDNQDNENTPHTSDLNQHIGLDNNNRDYVSSPGYDTSSSTAPASSPDPCEYTYEGAIQDYKSRVSRAQAGVFTTPIEPADLGHRRASTGSPVKKIEDRLLNFEIKATGTSPDNIEVPIKKDLPKFSIQKRRELFERESTSGQKSENDVNEKPNRLSGEFSQSISIRERLSNLEKRDDHQVKDASIRKLNRLSGEFSSVKDRLTTIEKPVIVEDKIVAKVDVPVTPLKERLSSLDQSVNKPIPATVTIGDLYRTETVEEPKKPVQLVEPQPQQILVKEVAEQYLDHEEDHVLTIRPEDPHVLAEEHFAEDSGVHSVDVSCSNSQITDDDTIVLSVEEQIKTQPAERLIPVNPPDIIPTTALTTQPRQLVKTTEAEPVIKEINEIVVAEQDTSVIEALEQAFDAIDIEELSKSIDETRIDSAIDDHIYENIDDVESCTKEQMSLDNNKIESLDESYYQVPKRNEPYYEVPKPKPIPLYENVEIFYPAMSSNGGNTPLPTAFPIGRPAMEPPKEKPPPPPVDQLSDDGQTSHDCDPDDHSDSIISNDYIMKRENSTKRIKKEIRNKRSSFLGIVGGPNVDDDESFLKLSIAPPPDISVFIEEERRLDKQMYINAGLYNSTDTMESRDSGVSENHSRQSSEPLTNSSTDEQTDFLGSPTKANVKTNHNLNCPDSQTDVNHRIESWNIANGTDPYPIDDSIDLDVEARRVLSLEHQIREQEEVLRVERELLQLEQEELKRQRENLLLRENLARRELDHGAKMLMSANNRSLQDINQSGLADSRSYVNVRPTQRPIQYPVHSEYRKSMPNLLHDFSAFDVSPMKRIVPPNPPAKPMRSQLSQQELYTSTTGKDFLYRKQSHPEHARQHSAPIQMAYGSVPSLSHPPINEDFVQVRTAKNHSNGTHQYGNMTRHTLHALSAVPKPKFQDVWVHPNQDLSTRRRSDFNGYSQPDVPNLLRRSISKDPNQQNKRMPEMTNNYHKHWLTQEVEQRRVDIQVRSPIKNKTKALPEAVIQTLTHRVQTLGIGERNIKRFDHQHQLTKSQVPLQNGGHVAGSQMLPTFDSQKEVLSVSGKKKCSYCSEELGRGAAMIIESLRLFYHLDCFKCCVCRVQLGDGVSGADVRVRNQQLHCHNCFSSDNGIKFSCV